MKIAKNSLTFILFLMTGIVLGGLLGEASQGIPYLSFLNYSKSFGISPDRPFILDFWIIKMVLGIEFRLSVAAIIGIISSVYIYKKVL